MSASRLAVLVALAVASSKAWAQGFTPDDFPPELEADAPDPGYQRFKNPAFPSPEIHAVPVSRGPKIERADFAPYFAQGKLAQARAAFEKGEWGHTQKLLDSVPDTAPVRYLRALAAYRGRDNAFASKELEALGEGYVPLRDRCFLQAGWAYEALRDWDSAARVFSRVRSDSRLSPDARLGLSRARRNLEDPAGALAALEGLTERPAPPWGRDVGAEALLTLADTLAWTGDKAGEHAALLSLWSRHPLSGFASRVDGRLDVAKSPKAAVVTRAEALVDAHRNAQGLAMLEPLLEGLKLPDPVACQAHHAAGKALRKLRSYARAAALLGPVAKKCADPDLRAKALYTLGVSQTIAAPAQSIETFETLARDYPVHPYADDALFYAAEQYQRRGDVAEARQRLIELVDRPADGDFTSDALFKLYWLTRDTNLDEAVGYLVEAEGRFRASEESAELERARYWRARTLADAGRKDEALALWTLVATEHPATYYGLIARERVEALDEEKGRALRSSCAAAAVKDDVFPMYAGPLSGDPQFLSAVELLRLGFGELVPLEVLAIDRTRLPMDSTRLIVHLLAMAGEERAAHGMARLWLRRDLSGPITRQNRMTWEVAYPKAFRDLVEERSDDAGGLDPDLLQALMREESALDPKALSWAGALGLCQLMPATAREVAGKLKLKTPYTSDLLEPELNIRLGARYLSDLVIRAKGVKQYALAGYNAGEGSVARWKNENPNQALDEWVENIPVQETRAYVKRVLRSYNTYKLLYAPTETPRTVSPVVSPPKPSKKQASASVRGGKT